MTIRRNTNRRPTSATTSASLISSQAFVGELRAIQHQNVSQIITPDLTAAAAGEPVETFAAQPCFGGEWMWGADETEDYQFNSALQVQHLFTWNNTSEGGTDGLTVTAGNSGGASGQPFDTVNVGGADIAFRASPATTPIDTLAYRVLQGTLGLNVEWNSFGAQPTLWVRTYVWVESWPSSTAIRLITFRSGGGLLAGVQITTGRQMSIIDSGASTIATGTEVLSLSQWYRIEAQYSATGTLITARLFTDPNSTTPADTISGGAAGGTTSIVRLGQGNADTGTVLVLDNLGISNSDWLGPLGTAPVGVPEPFAAQPAFPDWTWGADELEDYVQFQDDLDWFLGIAAPTEPIETFAAQPHYGDIGIDAPEMSTEEDWLPERVPIDIPEAPIETYAAQPHYGEWLWDADQTEDYTPLPDDGWMGTVAPPDTEATIAAQGDFPDWQWGADETEDYYTVSDDVDWFFGLAAVEPDETVAAQPHYGEWFWDADQTEDYTTWDDQTAQLVGPAAADEILASQPHYGEWLYEAEEWADSQTDDGWMGAVVPPEASNEIHAAQPSPDQTDFTEPDHIDSVGDPLDWFSGVGVFVEAVEISAARPHFGEWLWDSDATEDYANEAALDVSYIPVTCGYIDFYGDAYIEDCPDAFAAQLTFPNPEFPDEEAAPSYADDLAWFSGLGVVVEPDSTFAAQPHFGEWLLEPEEWADQEMDDGWMGAIVPPEIGASELAAQVAASNDPEFPDEAIPQTYTDDLSWLAGIAVVAEPVETFAAQLLLNEMALLDPDPPHDQPGDDFSWIAIVETPVETFATQPTFAEFEWPAPTTEDYHPESSIGVEWLRGIVPFVIEAFIAWPYERVIGFEPDENPTHNHTPLDSSFIAITGAGPRPGVNEPVFVGAQPNIYEPRVRRPAMNRSRRSMPTIRRKPRRL